MKILLVQRMEYLYRYGGGHKANRILMEAMVRLGHECRVIAPKIEMDGFKEYYQEMLDSGEIEELEDNEKLNCIRKQGVVVYTVKEKFGIYSFIKKMVEEYEPDVTIISEDRSHLLMEAVLETNTLSVYLSHSQTVLPFGPETFDANEAQTKLYQRLDGVMTVSHYLKGYCETWGHVKAETIYFPSYGEGPFPYLGRFENPYITVINPSSIKGLSILLGLARLHPELTFAAVVTWATVPEERKQLEAAENIKILDPVEDVNEIYDKTKVFLMPSLWGESFGQVVVEAMLRGIPVIASNVGGLPEAKQHIDYLLPVNPIKTYIKENNLHDNAYRPVIPEQDLGPWSEALHTLTTDKERYDALSKLSREKANEFYESLDFQRFEEYFERLITENKEKKEKVQREAKARELLLERIKKLPPEKRSKLYQAYQLKEGKE